MDLYRPGQATTLALASLSLACASPGAGRVPEESANRWSYELAPYLWAAGVEGDDATGGMEVELGLDLIDNLDVGGMLSFEAAPPGGPWSFLVDTLFVGFGDNSSNFDATLDVWIAETDVTYQPDGWDDIALLMGLRYLSIGSELDVDAFSADLRETWVDPIVGARGTTGIHGAWALRWRGDIGGFGVGSDFSYQVQALIVRPIGKSATFGLGWRHLAVDYDEPDFALDVFATGPLLAFSFGF